MSRRARVWAVAGVLAACGGSEPAEQLEAVGPDSVAIAAAAYDAAAFDTVTWESDQAAIDRGQVVFGYSCARCHGTRGFGDGGFVRGGDTLRPPSFHQASWEYRDDPEALRRKVFTGAEGGMPHWGLVGLKYRDVDAVTRYILEGLRGGT